MLRAEPFLQLSSGQEAYYYQLFVEKDEKLEMPSVQNLFEQSFLASDIKLKEVCVRYEHEHHRQFLHYRSFPGTVVPNYPDAAIRKVF